MKRAYKYRFYPTPDQVELLAQTFGCVRFVYNSILRWRTDAYYERQKKVGYTQANAKLTALKKESEFTWLNDVSSVPLGGRLENGKYPTLSLFFELAMTGSYERSIVIRPISFVALSTRGSLGKRNEVSLRPDCSAL
ncbi:Helix-turn-helix domain [Raoultella terrigena]|uniref:Helix-turn-helix domain n=1 Tax=Raoultella terrigena TaxID=577 RepID=A0A4U9DAU7_RAOTE|nr:Helix-turn-helix domain [Raoultella terrigena]